MYNHTNVDITLELDACLLGLRATWGRFVYHLSIPLYFWEMKIAHLKMVNIFLAIKVFQEFWKGIHVLVKCDNQAVVAVLQSSQACDPFLAACARNIWFIAALNDIELQYVHVLGKHNRAADLLLGGQVLNAT